MLRQSLRRATQLRCAVAAPLVARQQLSILASAQRPTSSALKATSRILATSLPRWNSSEAAAAEEPASGESSEAPTRFDELTSLGVNEALIKNITQGMGYEKMSPVQSATIAPALKGMDLVAQAKTGTGKTLGFLVPIIQRMITEDPSLATRSAKFQARSDDIRGIVLSPTRELAEQIAVEAEKLTRGTGVVVQRAVGGTQKNSMLHKTAREGCHLMVATPGRLNDLLSDPRSNIAAPNIAAVVLDEADRMLDVGFKNELEEIMDKLPDTREKPRQTLLYSATIPSSVVQLARDWVRHDNFDFIQTVNPNEALTHEKVPQHVVTCEGWGNVLPSLFEVIEREHAAREADPEAVPFKAIVFMPSTASVDLAAQTYKGLPRKPKGLYSWHIHSKLSQQGRTRAADSFRKSRSGILFSSDVTARGMDFPNVTHVIQVGAISDREQYIHRLGRTGRQDKEGEGWLILSHTDLGAARQYLKGLPIKPNDTIKAATEDFRGELSEHTKRIFDAMKSVDKPSLRAAYMSLFAQVTGQTAQGRITELKEWYVDGLGFPDTPRMGRNTAAKIGVARCHDLNMDGEDHYEDSYQSGGFGGGGGFGGRSGGGGFSRGGDRGGDRGGFSRGGDRGGDRGGFSRRDNDDPFGKMSSGGDRGGFSRGGDRGFSRGGDRGFSRGGDRGGFRRGNDRGGRGRDSRDSDASF